MTLTCTGYHSPASIVDLTLDPFEEMLALRQQFPRPMPDHISHGSVQVVPNPLLHDAAQAGDDTEQRGVPPAQVEAASDVDEATTSQVREVEPFAGMSDGAPSYSAGPQAPVADFPMDTDQNDYRFDFSEPQWSDRWEGQSDTSDAPLPPPTESSGSVASYEGTGPRASFGPPSNPWAHSATAFPNRQQSGAPPYVTGPPPSVPSQFLTAVPIQCAGIY